MIRLVYLISIMPSVVLVVKREFEFK